MESSPTTSIILDKRRALKDGTYPIKLRITFQRKSRMYKTGKTSSIKDFEKITGAKPRGEFKETQVYVNAIEKKAIDVCNCLSEFSFQLFEKQFLSNRGNPKNVYNSYEKKIQSLYSQERIGTASSYESSLASLKSFRSSLKFNDVDESFLEAYEKFMLASGKSVTTIGIYLRPLQAIFNEAIRNDYVSASQYPFGRYKYQIPTGVNVKKALKLADIEKIYKFKPLTQAEGRARDLWLFSYLCNGINIKDIARLKYDNVVNDKITFIRAKTARRTRSNPKPISVPITPDLQKILDKWGVKPKTNNQYVFNIHQYGLTAIEEKRREMQAVKTINKYMKRIGEACKIDQKVTTYTARHSFSTILKQSGVSIEYISESLGHSDLKVTENYLDGFEDKTKIEHSKKLLDFDK